MGDIDHKEDEISKEKQVIKLLRDVNPRLEITKHLKRLQKCK